MNATYQLPSALQTLVDAARQRRDEKLAEGQREKEAHEASLRLDFTRRVKAIGAQVSPYLVEFVEDKDECLEVIRVGYQPTVLIRVPGCLPIHVRLARREDGYHVIPDVGRDGPFGLFGVGDSDAMGNRLQWTNDLGEAVLLAAEAF